MNKSPHKETFKEKIQRIVASDPITIRDKQTMREKWGIEVRASKRTKNK